jgi:thiol-disulfide isomerase/thioredoxin
MSFTSTALIVSWGAILVLAMGLAGVVRQVQLLTSGRGYMPRSTGPSIGQVLDPVDAPWTRPTLLLFLSTDCFACDRLLPEFETLAADSAGELEFVAVFAGEGRFIGEVTVLTHRGHLFDQLDVTATPFAIAVDETGRVQGASTVGSPNMLNNMVTSIPRREEVPA